MDPQTARETEQRAVVRKKVFLKPEVKCYELPAITYGSNSPYWVGPADID